MNSSGWLISGTISLICGCMFAGKTDELIRRLKVLKITKKNILVFKPKIDSRYQNKKSELVTHDNTRFKTFIINDVKEMKSILNKTVNFDGIAIDEVQFLSVGFLPLIKKLAKNKKIIICAGLDKDYWNRYDSLMSRLLVEADVVDKLFAICAKCNKIATHTQRLKNGQPVNFFEPKILVGGAENYEARCKFCYIDFEN